MEVQQASEETAKILVPFLERFRKNIYRTKELLEISELILTSQVKNKSEIANDQCRAAVVFLHATLEDALRSLATMYLPMSDESQLNLVPLVGTGSGNRAEKFFLGKLASHRGKTVNQLIEDSVMAYLSRSNYSDTTEIASLLHGLGMEPEFLTSVSKQFPAIDQLMRRRHEIVHRADMSFGKPEAPEKVNPITKNNVLIWISSVEELTKSMTAHIIHTEMTARIPSLKDYK